MEKELNICTEALRAAEMRQGCTNHSYYAEILLKELRAERLDRPAFVKYECNMNCPFAYKNEALQIDCACLASQEAPEWCPSNKPEEMDRPNREKIAEIIWGYPFRHSIWTFAEAKENSKLAVDVEVCYNDADQLLALIPDVDKAVSEIFEEIICPMCYRLNPQHATMDNGAGCHWCQEKEDWCKSKWGKK